MRTKLFAVTILSLLAITVWGQRSRQERKIDPYYDSFNYTKAIEKYEKLKTISLEGKRRLADSYCKTSNFEKAIATYDQWVNSDLASKDDLYNYSSVLRMKGEWTLANQYMTKFCALYPEDMRARNFKSEILKFPDFSTDRGSYVVTNLDFNSKEADFGPTYYSGSVVFASSRSRKLQLKEVYNWNQKPFLNLYQAKVFRGQFIDPIPFNKSINKKWHEGTASFYMKNRSMVFTRDNYQGKSGSGEINLQLFFSDYIGDNWSEPIPFKYNDSEHSMGHPCITEDGKTLYFASNFPGGYGGVDIYRSQKDSFNQWTKPVNLGDKINTMDDDMFPFFDQKNQLLYFASRGHLGLGGLDIFKVKISPDSIGEVENLGMPVNSISDDFSFIIDNNSKSGYFASNRTEGKGDDDIYSFKVIQKIELSPIIPTAQISTKSDSIANVPVSLAVTDSSSDLSMKSVEINQVEKNTRKTHNLGEGKEGSSRKIEQTEQLEQAESIELKHLYYEFNRSDLRSSAITQLESIAKLLKSQKTLKIELYAHTDNRGSELYNMRLSQRRAQSAARFIVNKGISKLRIKSVGKGESELIKVCAECSEKDNMQNRRTEIVIPGYGRSEEDSTEFENLSDSVIHSKTTSQNKIVYNELIDLKSITEKNNNQLIRYYLYVASFPNDIDAQKLTSNLQKIGYNAEVVDMQTFYRVGIGCHTMSAARKLYDVLKFKYKSAWIDMAK
ncbi:MAG: OmpA family protein [Bacteroidales bacterium]|nr:OmpA family protein [Bacteroidales bacterium]